MTFADWFASEWKRQSESQSAALQRLSTKTGVSYKSLFYALKGCRATPTTAETLAKLSRGAIDKGSMVLAPTRAEMGIGRTGTDG